MDETEVKFTKNKRLIDNDDGSHVGGSLYNKKSLTKNMSEDEEYRARKAFEHQQDIDEAFNNH